MDTTQKFHPRACAELAAQLSRPLPFYPDCPVEPATHGAGMALRWQKQPYVLDWTNEALYRLNDAGALRLTRRTVAAYAKFFFNVVRGPNGCYALVEPDDPIAWLPTATGNDKEIIRNLLRPLTVTGIDGDGMFCLDAHVIFSDYRQCALFRTVVRVAPKAMPLFDPKGRCLGTFSNGQLQIGSGETLLLEGIPVAVPVCPWITPQDDPIATPAPADDDVEVIEGYDDYDLFD